MKNKNFCLTILTLIIIDCFIIYKYSFITKELNNSNYGSDNATILQPVEPDKPIESDKPIKPEEPDKPIESDKPIKPEEPIEPNKPIEPEKPIEPNKPIEPEPDKSKYNYSKIDLSIKNNVVKNSKIVMPKKLDEVFDNTVLSRNLTYYVKSDKKNIDINIIIQNKIAYFTFEDKKVEIPVENVKEAHIMHGLNGCDVYSYFIILLTDDGDVYYFIEWETTVILDKNVDNENQLIEYLEKIGSFFNKINLKNKYNELLYIVYPTRVSCGKSYELLGKNEQGIFNIRTEKKHEKMIYDNLFCSSKDQSMHNYCYLMNEKKELIDEYFFESFRLSLKFLMDDYVISNENFLYLRYIDKEDRVDKHKYIGKIKELYLDKKDKMAKFVFENNDILEYHYENIGY